MILGNNDRVVRGGESVNYNAVMHYSKGKLQDMYYKKHLVPFSEHFPYEKILPWLHKYILSLHVNFYGKGTEYTLFEESGFTLAPLICFEDTFGYLSRNFVKRGGEVLLNLTNDSWSTEYACNIQHLAIATFRAVENRRSMVRTTTGGYTTVIDPNGKRIGELEPFTNGYLITETPVYTGKTTIYTRFGNYLDILAIILSLGGIILGIFLRIKRGGREDSVIKNGSAGSGRNACKTAYPFLKNMFIT